MTDSRGELRDVRDAVDGHPMRRLFEYVTPYWKRLSAGIVASFVMRIARLVPALAVAAAIDRAIRGSGEAGILARIGLVTAESVPAGDPQVALLYRLALIAAVAWVVQAITQFASRYLFQSAAQLIQHDLRDDTYAHMQSLSMDFFDDHESGALMAVLNSDVNRLENFFNNEIRQIIRAIVMFGVVGAVMLYEAPKLALIALAPMPILGLFTGRFMLWIEPRYKRIRELVSGLNTRLANNLGGVDVIKSFDRYGIERERVAGFSEAYRDRKIEVIRIRKAFFSSQRLLIGLSFVAVLVLGGRAIVDTPRSASQRASPSVRSRCFSSFSGDSTARSSGSARPRTSGRRPKQAPSASSAFWVTSPRSPHRRTRSSRSVSTVQWRSRTSRSATRRATRSSGA